MRGVNKVILIGNLGKDPQVQYLENGIALARFSIATTKNYTDRNTTEKREETQWHNIVLWGGLAEIAEKYLKKGNPVYIEGELTHRSYEGKDGQMRYITEVVGRELTMLGGRSDSGYMPPPVPPQYSGSTDMGSNSNNTSPDTASETNPQVNTATDSATPTDPEDDLPF